MGHCWICLQSLLLAVLLLLASQCHGLGPQQVASTLQQTADGDLSKHKKHKHQCKDVEYGMPCGHRQKYCTPCGAQGMTAMLMHCRQVQRCV